MKVLYGRVEPGHDSAGAPAVGWSVPRAVAVAVLVLAAGLAGAPHVAAQQQDLQPLLDRIDRLERDVNLLQRQVYRGTGPAGTPVPVNPPDGPAVLSAEVRLDQVDDEVRQLTGQVQDIANSVNQLKHRLDALSSDIDQRFAMLGNGTAAPAPPQPPRSTAGAPPPPPGPGTLGTLHSNPPPANAQANEAPQDLPSGTPLEQYNYAFGLLRRADYPDAERMLKAFVQKHPNDPLAANAQYWLGQVYLTRKNYQDAATAFAVGYQKYPKSPKAAENLLSLGMSLGSLGKKQDACAAFARLDRDFPSAAPNIKEREASERQRLGCS